MFTVYPLPLTMRYPFSMIHGPWLKANGKCTVNGKREMVNEISRGVI